MKTPLRDRLAYWLATAAMRIATPHYRQMCNAVSRYGLDAAARDEAQGIEAPDPWPTTALKAGWIGLDMCRCEHLLKDHFAVSFEATGSCSFSDCDCDKFTGDPLSV